ncbi:CaiB/BaiF CoA transferase family protein [Biformimicrobium ophioploci]|uniref:CoA transferase n=1 Tax=Biformimicrobium ophioploci TaxID=3036711 RepID=A0ABQ6M0D7_9GAMM|nr:CaiB/BaiF CoA-transferase family protein [Microbulbifer sp. NKW57]GMG87819.1 CoA transferase [Microbulbifer sp. NKW57]
MTKPLEGLKVLDFSTLLPGPYATMMLADLGATVLRIEAPHRPDLLRFIPPMVGGSGAVSAAHASINRGKASLALDLKQPESIGIIERLLGEYDILVEQFRPGVMDKLGLGYKTLSAFNPRLIYCSISGYGQSGPKQADAGHDINYLAASGLASYSGRADTGPVLSGLQIADIAGGAHHAVMGVLAAANARHSSGRGAHIDISMTDCAFALNTICGASALGGGPEPHAGTELLNGGTHYDYYRTADGRHLAVGCLEPQFAQRFFAAIGQPEWNARTAELVPEALRQLKADIATVIGAQPLAYWTDIFDAVDACVEPVKTFSEAADSQLMRERGMLARATLDDGSHIPQISNPILIDGARAHASRPPDAGHTTRGGGLPGRDSIQILTGLGYSEEEIAYFLASGAVAEAAAIS